MKELKDRCKNLDIQKLEAPVEFFTCLGNMNEQQINFTAPHKIIISVTIYLPGTNIPVCIRDVELFATDQEMSEVILGRPFLKALGFDLKTHLLEVHDQVHNKRMTDLENSGKKIASWKYNGLRHQAVDDDPIECPDIIAAGIGRDSEESIDNALKKYWMKQETMD